MEYKYPDKNDKLTIELIDNEYDGQYWAKSEEWVLEKAVQAVKNLKERDDKKTFLDLGCGLGRLMEVFAPDVDKVTAVEPDAHRYAHAADEGLRLRTQCGYDVEVIHGDASCLDEETKFDGVLSSHVLQHITTNMAQEMLETIAAHMDEGGILTVTTTYNEGEEDIFQKEGWVNGERVSEVITAEEFDQCFGVEGILPVRIFAQKSIVAMAELAGLSLQTVCYYHYKDHNNVKEDAEANEAGRGIGARDAMYIFQKKETLIDANIGYHFSFSIFDEETGLRTDDEGELRESIKRRYADALFYDGPNAGENSVFADLKTAEGFLHGGGLPFNCFRVMLNEYDLKMEGFDVFESGVMMTVFPESDTVQVWISLSMKNLKADNLVYLRHVQGNGAKLINKDGRKLSIRDVFNETKDCIGRKITDIEETYIAEIKRFGDFDDVDYIIDNYSRPLYGIMCGDEGWRHVPVELTKERLVNKWGSRSFIRLISFGANSIFFNLSQSKAAVAYRENRRRFDNEFYGDMNPYFLIDNNFAGINHGVFFSIELVMVIKTICNRILRRQSGYYRSHDKNISKDIRQTKDYRGELLTILNKVENLQISEIGEMERVLLISQQIDPIIEKIKYLLELVESELDLLYQTSTNKLANAFAIGGLVFAGIQILLAL